MDADVNLEARTDAAWERIERWMAARAPHFLAGLRQGASAASIRDGERRLRVRFPPDIVASLLRHDGQEWRLRAVLDGFEIYGPAPGNRAPSS